MVDQDHSFLGPDGQVDPKKAKQPLQEGNQDGFRQAVTDITRDKNLQERRRRAKRAETVDNLAGRVSLAFSFETEEGGLNPKGLTGRDAWYCWG